MANKHIDEVTGIDTTGHEWDGIRELNNPLPAWWVWTFYITIIWAIAYTVAYPAWPLLSSNTKGMLGWSSRGDVSENLKAARAAQAEFVDAIASKDVAAILADDKLREFATAGGAAAFKVNCVQCHGSGAEGSPGFPNLNDDDWLWGGSADAIYTTLTHGIRDNANGDTRISEMPAFADILNADQIGQVAAYAASLTGAQADAAKVEAGKTVYAENCASCHGDDAKGGRDFGAPNLTDAIALYAGDEASIAAQVARPQHGVMPAWGARLGDTTVKQLAVYVHSLGGGE